jgi:hypothetical protein
MVVFEIKDAASKGDSLHDFTDDHGSYRMDFSGLNKATRVSIHAQAKGFREPAAIALSSLLDDNRHDFVMMPLARPSPTPVAIPHGTPAATPVATPGPQATPPRLLHPPEYIRKVASPAIRIEFKR